MNMFLSYIILFVCIVSNVSCTKRNQNIVKPKGRPRSGYANYIARPRFRNQVGDTVQNGEEANFDSNTILKDEERLIDTTGEFFDKNEAESRLKRKVMNDQRPRGTTPYRYRHRYFGGRKRGAASNNAVKRVVLSLRTKSNMNDKRIADDKSYEDIVDNNIQNLRDSSVRRSALQKDQYDDLKFITPNDLAIELIDDDMDDTDDAQFMQEDFSKMSNAELDAVIANRMNSYMMQKDLDNADYLEKKNDEKRVSNKKSYEEDTGLKKKKSTSLYRDRDEINYSVDADEFLDLDNAVRNNLVKDGSHSMRRLSVDGDAGFEQFNDNTSDDDFRALLRSQ